MGDVGTNGRVSDDDVIDSTRFGEGGDDNVNPLTPRRTLVSPFTEISILF